MRSSCHWSASCVAPRAFACWCGHSPCTHLSRALTNALFSSVLLPRDLTAAFSPRQGPADEGTPAFFAPPAAHSESWPSQSSAASPKQVSQSLVALILFYTRIKAVSPQLGVLSPGTVFFTYVGFVPLYSLLPQFWPISQDAFTRSVPS